MIKKAMFDDLFGLLMQFFQIGTVIVVRNVQKVVDLVLEKSISFVF